MTDRPLAVALFGFCSFIGGGAVAQEPSGLKVLELLTCSFPDTCHQDQCFTVDRPVRLFFVTLGEDPTVRVAALLPEELGSLPAGLTGGMSETRRLRFGRKPDVIPIRSMSIHSGGSALISIWMDDGMGSYTQGGTCKVVPPKNDGATEKN